VPEGTNTYTITHWSSPRDTILLKFAYESPKQWTDITATEYQTVLEAVEEERIITYYQVTKEKPVTLRIKGPTRLRIIARLNYDERLMGDQQYTIVVKENGEVEKFPLKCYKSHIITYRDKKDIVPSNARSMYMNIEEGWHTLEFSLSGTLANSAGLRFLVEEE
jgi:hypothetical protein